MKKMNKIENLAKIFAMNKIDDKTRIETGKNQRYNYFVIGFGKSTVIHKAYKVIWEALKK